MDADKLAAGTLVFLFLGGSLLAALWVLAESLVPVALGVYLLIAVLLFARLRRAASIWDK
ncbi:hypothetical protein [Halovenus halobia]|uniref:hypothetical protein n=1 Tax=Halovenus halobia TaxID=3396622 RepID=UPI003F559F86